MYDSDNFLDDFRKKNIKKMFYFLHHFLIEM